jgi:glycosyltransferase involved in cell wall biosynthesis
LELSIILPAKNEAENLASLLPELRTLHPDAEIILVNDGSTDNTEEIAKNNDVMCISHPYSMGNGAAIKTGARNANGDILVFMDADGQHQPKDIARLLDLLLSRNYDMVVGARSRSSQASLFRLFANHFYSKLASFMTGKTIKDLTSGFRAVRSKKFRKFLYLLPNGFSYPTTITMAFFRSGYSVTYLDILTLERKGVSKINLVRDGFRFFIIILRIGSLFSPMRLFLPISAFLFSTGIAYYVYTYMVESRFTNMGVVLLLSSLFVFLIGILSEQISALHYRDYPNKD